MREHDLLHLAADLEASRIDVEGARRLAASVPAREPWGGQVATLTADAIDAYTAGRKRGAWAAATVAAAVAEHWIETRSRPWPRRGSDAEGALDVRARALAVLSFVDADDGRDESAGDLRRESERILTLLGTATTARFAIGVTAAQRTLRLGRTAEAIAVLEDVMRLPALSDSQRAAAQAVLAGAMSVAGRSEEAIASLQASAQSFHRAGLPSAALEADLERGINLMQAGDFTAARSLLAEVATSAAATAASQVEAHARLRLGKIAGGAGEHAEAAEQFQLAAAAAKRVDDYANLVVALRNAADELRLQNDLVGAERLLNEALALRANPKIAIDLAKAKYHLAVVKHQMGGRDDADRLLDEAAADFEHKLQELGASASPRVREHLEAQVRQVASLREKLSR